MAHREDLRSEEVTIPTTQGETAGLLYRAQGSENAVLWAGAWQGEDKASPIAASVATALLEDGVSSLLLRYRERWELPSCVQDADSAIVWLSQRRIARVALVGHSFSGAVVISAAQLRAEVAAVAALASQTYGATGVARIHPRPLLLVHGTDDERLAPYCSEQIYSWARKPKELRFMQGATHGLMEATDELLPLLREWLAEKLRSHSETGD